MSIKNKIASLNYLLRLKFIKSACKNEIKALERFKNIHRGERCFVIGNGPSLTSKDLDLLKDEITFSANRVFLGLDNTVWRPYYYCVSDNGVLINNIEAINALVAQEKFLPINSLALFKKGKDFYTDANYYNHVMPKSKDAIKPDFSEDITKGICTGGTVSYVAIQIAVYMGFKEIYLLGTDHNYIPNNSYFYKSSEEEKNKNIDMRYATAGFQKAREYADSHGIKIYNATRGGHLEVFERIDFDSISF